MKTQSSVKILALVAIAAASLQLAACSIVKSSLGETCKSRAYVQQSLADYVSARFERGAPVRMGIIPFSVPANLASKDVERPGLGNELAWMVHRNLLGRSPVPILEVMNREDWPGKKEEFFSGNFAAIAMGRDAGYDLIMVGYVEPFVGLDSMLVHTKVIEVESGVTVWYGDTTAKTRRVNFDRAESFMRISDFKPSNLYIRDIEEKAAACIADGVLSDPIE